MSANVIVKVQVEKLTKYGYADSEGYVSYSKNLTDHDKALVVPGASFEAELYTAPSGSRYLNKIVARSAHVAAPKAVESQAAAATVDVERAKKFTPKFTKVTAVDNSMSKADWANKDRNMMIGGRSHDAAVIVASMLAVSNFPTTEDVLKAYKQVLQGMLTIADEIK